MKPDRPQADASIEQLDCDGQAGVRRVKRAFVASPASAVLQAWTYDKIYNYVYRVD